MAVSHLRWLHFQAKGNEIPQIDRLSQGTDHSYCRQACVDLNANSQLVQLLKGGNLENQLPK